MQLLAWLCLWSLGCSQFCCDGCYLCAILQLLLQGLGASGVGQFGVMAVPIHGPPFLQSDLAVSPEVPSAGRVGLMAGVRGFASNGVVYLGAG